MALFQKKNIRAMTSSLQMEATQHHTDGVGDVPRVQSEGEGRGQPLRFGVTQLMGQAAGGEEAPGGGLIPRAPGVVPPPCLRVCEHRGRCSHKAFPHQVGGKGGQ